MTGDDEDGETDGTKDRKGDESARKPVKVSEKEVYEKSLKRKKRDWKQFIGFMKHNPEALMSLTD